MSDRVQIKEVKIPDIIGQTKLFRGGKVGPTLILYYKLELGVEGQSAHVAGRIGLGLWLAMTSQNVFQLALRS